MEYLCRSTIDYMALNRVKNGKLVDVVLLAAVKSIHNYLKTLQLRFQRCSQL